MNIIEVAKEKFKQFAPTSWAVDNRTAIYIIAALISLYGLTKFNTMPKEQFPDIVVPTISVVTVYAGNSPKDIENLVTRPIEKQLKGISGAKVKKITSTSQADYSLIVTEFDTDVKTEIAKQKVKDAIDKAKTDLPDDLTSEPNVAEFAFSEMPIMFVNVSGDYDGIKLKQYADKLQDRFEELTEITRAEIVGAPEREIQVNVDPYKMSQARISFMDVENAISRENRDITGGTLEVGDMRRTIKVKGQFTSALNLNNIVVRSSAQGGTVYLKDIAELKDTIKEKESYARLDGKNVVTLNIVKRAGENLINAADKIKNIVAEMKEKEELPKDLKVVITGDLSKATKTSFNELVNTIIIGFILVLVILMFFMGVTNAFFVALSVPLSVFVAFMFLPIADGIIGTTVTLNFIVLFALLLGLGIIVDDAIVVVEAVHAKMAQEHISPYKAVKKVLGEISGAVIAITLLMTSVFIPISFMTGPVGVFYRQFSVTIASAIVLSGLIALTLTPVLCAMILKDTHGKPRKRTILNRFLDGFNRGFEKLTNTYVWLLRKIAHRRIVTGALWLGFGVGIFLITETLPSGFIPSEDQGMIYAIIQTPPGSTLERTNDLSSKLQDLIREVDGVQSVSSIAGYEVLTEGRGSNAGTCLINLKPWSERKHTVNEMIIELEELAKELPGATIEFFEPPAVPGYGAAGGFSLQLLDKTNSGDYLQLERVKNEFMAELGKRKEVTGLFTFFSANYPQYEIEIDNDRAMQKGVTIGNAMNTLSIFVGSTYELGFIKFQRFFKVFVQAAPEFRRLPSDLLNLYVKSDHDEMVPFSSFMKLKKQQGANEINRYNMYNTAAIRGAPSPGYSSGEAIEAIKEVAKKLPRGFDIAWANLSFDEVRRGNESLYIFLIVLGFVYLVLAAQYESFIIPLAVILSLPAGVFGSFMLIDYLGLANDIYAQVGLIMLVGLLGKNAVLIVEFAMQKHQQGATVLEAAIEGARVRFRPILMTSFAFIVGLIPLVAAHGAGAIGNRTIGSSALGGMLFGTAFGVIIVPGLFYIFGSIAEGRKLIRDEEEDSLSEEIVHKIDAFPQVENGNEDPNEGH